MRWSESALVRAAGGLLWRGGPEGLQLAIIHRRHQGDWRLPKGRLERGEAPSEAALREVAEETGIRARLEEWAGFTASRRKGRRALSLFWHMSARRAGSFEPGDEVDRMVWLPPEQAVYRLDSASERRLVRRHLMRGREARLATG